MSKSKRLNIVIFGIGNVGSTLINQLNELRGSIFEQYNINVDIPVITNSNIAFYSSNRISQSWKSDFNEFSIPYKIDDIIKYTRSKNLENLVAIDVTASSDLVSNYGKLIESGFHIVSANKIANTLPISSYKELRSKLKKHNKYFLYETNVGAGLPIIETVKSLHRSGDQIQKIRGVFSGSLSYIFNTYSNSDLPFSRVINKASNLGLTEPDVREDLSGTDVARKLLILARELEIGINMKDIKVQSLVPKQLNGKTTLHQFNLRKKEMDEPFNALRKKAGRKNVLRYVAELNVPSRSLEVKLVEENSESSIGRLKGSDSLFEVYTSAYGEEPLIIQGAGAGKEVTARGIISDVLKITNTI